MAWYHQREKQQRLTGAVAAYRKDLGRVMVALLSDTDLPFLQDHGDLAACRLLEGQ